MPRSLTFISFFAAIFLQAGAYGLTFMLPRLFDSFGASEKVVGTMLLVTTLSTIVTVYFSGHLSDLFGRIRTLPSPVWRYRHRCSSTDPSCRWARCLSWPAFFWDLDGG